MAFKKSEPAEPAQPEPAASGPVKKSTPTPTRREAEAARRQRLNPVLSPKEAKKRQRQQSVQAEQKRRMTEEAGPERQLLRDFIDSRFNLAEYMMPILLVVIAATLIPAMMQYVQYAVYVSWAYLLAVVVDGFLTYRRFKRLAQERIAHPNFRGLGLYSFNRQMTFRRWRQPNPRVKRGEKI